MPPQLQGGNTDGGNEANRTIIRTRLSGFLCPSDAPSFGTAGPVSYRCSLGVGPFPVESMEFPDSGDGVFGGVRPRRLTEISDGLSQTIAMSERLLGPGTAPESAVHAGLIYLTEVGRSIDSTTSACGAVTSTTPAFEWSGRYWFYSGTEYTWYNHLFTPNTEIPDCGMSPPIPLVGAVTARSRHREGVNVLVADGAVGFVGNAIDSSVWRALATKSNNDVGVVSF